MRHCGWLLGLLSLFSLATHASDWQEIKNEAKGQTVWFNAWGGDTAINRYLDWVSGEMKTHYAINLKIVRLADAADAVKRIQTEAASVTPPTVDDALRTRLAAHFDAQALTELTALIGLQNLSARFNSAMDIPAQGLCRIPEKRS